MRYRIAPSFLIGLMALGMLFFQTTVSHAQSTNEDAKLAAEDKEGCIRNLKLIYEAIQAYQVDHKELPNWLSDLVPQYIDDANVLICPACKRTGQAETSALADPKIPSSYLFEFCPLLLGTNLVLDGIPHTRREWKRRQMGIVGAVVPVVRCRHHAKTLNLGFDGKIYESPVSWEDLLTNRVDVLELSPARIFASSPTNTTSVAKAAALRARRYPKRADHTKPQLIDLTAHYNATLKESWHGGTNKNNLATLPTGVQTFGGTDFDVRGIIQLGGRSKHATNYPPSVLGIKVRQKCERLQFLQATGFGVQGEEGQRVGSYIVHFATNQMQLEIPIIYGRDARNWQTVAGEKIGTNEAPVVWTGTNAVTEAAHSSLRLYKTTWVNVAPTVAIDSIDFVSAMDRAAPFVIAITAE